MNNMEREKGQEGSEDYFLGYRGVNERYKDAKLITITAAAMELGIFGITEQTLEDDRQEAASKLATDLVHNPSRVMYLEDIDPERGILSNLEKGIQPVSPSRRIQDASDKVSFTFGIPYFFHRHPPYRRKDSESSPVLVVLDHEQLFNSDDTEVLFMDAGLIYRHFNPINGSTEGLREGRPDMESTELEKLYLEILSDPDIYSEFSKSMSNVFAKYSLDAEQLQTYMIEYVYRSIPIYEDDEMLIDRWRGTHAPEGRVEKVIGFNAIKAIILPQEQLAQVTDMSLELIPGIDIVPVSREPDEPDNANSRLNLVRAYMDLQQIGGLDSFTKLYGTTGAPGTSIDT